MKNIKTSLITAATALTLLSLGCQQATDFKTSKALHATSCASQKAVDPQNLKIQGQAGAVPGESVRYRLNEDLGCVPDQSVSWASASGKALGVGGQYISTYKKPGEYVVAARVQTAGSLTPYEVSYKTVVTDGLALSGPQVGMAEVDNHFELVVPADAGVTGAQWNFGDGQPGESGLGPIDYAYFSAGTYTVTVTVSLANGDTSVLNHVIQILPSADGLSCVNELSISGPSEAVVGQPVSFTAYIPSCVAYKMRQIRWDFADGSPAGTDQTVDHTYQAAGTYHVTASLYLGESSSPFVTLGLDLNVSANDDGTDPGDDGGDDPGTPTDPNQCSMLGQQRQMNGELYSEQTSCGINGHKTNTYRDQITEECRQSGEINKWVEISRTKELMNEGQCEGQACEVPVSALNGADPTALGLLLIGGKYYLPDGGSKVFYSSTSPAGACSEVASTRSCSNGMLGGSSEYSNLVCHSGCPGFGQNGSTKTGVVTGQESVAHTCAYGETGIFDIFTQVSDQMCVDGQVVSSNTRRGSIKTAGVCPTYAWTGTERYSACSANCGGSQTRIFECRDGNGALAPSERCTGAAPVVTRVCDGNPDAVKSSESTVATEDAGSSASCPANQIGVVDKTRQVTTTTNYACIDHRVQQASQTVTNGAWETVSYCRDYVPHRCSQDSLGNVDAIGRYQWMVKCADQVPVIKDFLAQFESFQGTARGKTVLMYNGREVYATFMNRASKPEKPWIAPVMASASCKVPSTVYIAAVCTASCATPEQMILSQADGGKMAYTPFVQNWQEKVKYVATLQEQSSMNSKRVGRTEVDYWVTELLDGDHEILNFTTKSGGVLRLTPNHPVLTVNGTMKLAGDFKVGDSLVRLGGVADEIVSIEKTNYFGKVYNVFVKTNDLHRNIVVTNGYLNGTAYFQNDGKDHLNEALFRKTLTRGVFEP